MKRRKKEVHVKVEVVSVEDTGRTCFADGTKIYKYNLRAAALELGSIVRCEKGHNVAGYSDLRGQRDTVE